MLGLSLGEASGCALLSLACFVEEEGEKEPYSHAHCQLDCLESSHCGEYSPGNILKRHSVSWLAFSTEKNESTAMGEC